MTDNTRDLEDRIDTVDSYTGDQTELVSVAVPPGKPLRSVRERIQQEHATAENIKQDTTRDRVQQALSRIERTLRQYETTPENGLVVYAGVIDGDLQSFAFDALPAPVDESLYKCASTFETRPVESIVAPDSTYGLVVVERGGAAIGRLVGDRVVVDRDMDSAVMGKSRAGGQSAQRFARERERQLEAFFTKVGKTAS